MKITNYESMQMHPYCMAIPEMTEKEFVDLREDISGSGQLEPIVVFEGMILDGRHRFRACLDLGIEPWFTAYDGPDSAKDYVISKNIKRRNLTEAQRTMAMAALARLQRGNPTGANQHKKANPVIEDEGGNESIDSFPPENPINRKEAAEIAGVGIATMERAMKVDRQGSPELVKAVSDGTISVSAAAKVVDLLPDPEQQNEAVEAAKSEPRKVVQVAEQVAKKAEQRGYITLDQWQESKLSAVPEILDSKSKFNPQKDAAEGSMGNIEWASWSWNPVTGCNHNCPYCYARDIAQRFYPQGFTPTLHPDRLRAPYNTPMPRDAEANPVKRNVFANSMSDLYGRWVPQEWIDAVFKAMADNPQWNFLTLTKFPKRAAELVYPSNVWIGTSVDMQARVKAAEDAFERIECGVRWLSIEPMLEPLTFSKPGLFDWVVIGGASSSSQTPEWTPPAEWLVRVASQFLDANPNVRIYIKTNGRPREFPGGDILSQPHESFRYLGK